MEINSIIEKKEILKVLISRSLWKQYKKAKEFILVWNFISASFKERQPKWAWIYYFRINRQFRALGFIKNKELFIFKIDNHQN